MSDDGHNPGQSTSRPDLPTPPAPPPASAPPPPAPPAPSEPPPLTSPDGSITYYSTDSQPTPGGQGPHKAPSSPQTGSTAGAPPPGTLKRSAEITAADTEASFVPRGGQPASTGIGTAGAGQRRPGFLGRIFRSRIIAGIAIFAVVGIIGYVRYSGTTTVDKLEAGDCFELGDIPDATEISRVTDQDCARSHDAELFATVETSKADLEGACLEAFFELEAATRTIDVPPDAEVAFFEGTQKHGCVLYSQSGQLVGSIVD